MRSERRWQPKRRPKWLLRHILATSLLLLAVCTVVLLRGTMPIPSLAENLAPPVLASAKPSLQLTPATTQSPRIGIVESVPTALHHGANTAAIVAGGSDECTARAGEAELVENWRKGERLACYDRTTNVRVRELVQCDFEYRPQIYVFENMDFDSPVGGLLPNGCPGGETFLTGEESNVTQPWAQGDSGRAAYMSRNVTIISDRVLIRVDRFDVFNPYEAFHAFLNTYFLLRVLDINQTEVQFAMTDDCADSPNNEMLWNSMNHFRFPVLFTRRGGLVVDHHDDNKNGAAFRYKLAVQASSAGTSILCTAAPPLTGRDTDHHCSSSAFRNATSWLP